MKNDELENLRKKIDEIDDETVKLIVERFCVVKEIGEYKRASGIAICSPERENEVLTRVLSKVPDEQKPYVEELFKKVFALSKEYQKNG